LSQKLQVNSCDQKAHQSKKAPSKHFIACKQASFRKSFKIKQKKLSSKLFFDDVALPLADVALTWR
jgi:hypothetical protein